MPGCKHMWAAFMLRLTIGHFLIFKPTVGGNTTVALAGLEGRYTPLCSRQHRRSYCSYCLIKMMLPEPFSGSRVSLHKTSVYRVKDLGTDRFYMLFLGCRAQQKEPVASLPLVSGSTLNSRQVSSKEKAAHCYLYPCRKMWDLLCILLIPWIRYGQLPNFSRHCLARHPVPSARRSPSAHR